MQIHPAHPDPLRAAQASVRPAQGEASSAGRPTRVSAGDPQGILPGDGPVRPAAERVDAFAEKLHQRLQNYSAKTGLDLSHAAERFDAHIARIQSGLAEGSFGPDALAKALSTTVDLLRDDVRAATAPADELDRRSATQRVLDFSDRLAKRIGNVLAEHDGPRAQGLQGALDHFQHNVDRILSAIAEGTMDAGGIEKALDGLVAYATRDVQRAMRVEPDGAEVAPAVQVGGDGVGDAGGVGDDAARPVEERFESFAEGVMKRLAHFEAAGLTREQAAGLAELKAAFASAVERLDQGFFEGGGLSRKDFVESFQVAFRDLKRGVSNLFADPLDGQPDGGRIYHPATGIEELGGSLLPRFDRTA